MFKSTDRRPINRWLLTLAAILVSAVLSSPAQAGQNVTLAWDPSPDTNVIGYILYYGVVGGTSTNSLDAANQTTATAANLNAGTTEFFFVTAYNALRVESAPSNLITYAVPAANIPPTISGIADQSISANSATPALSFTIGDAETPASSLALSGASSNPSLIPSGNIVFGGSGTSRTVTVSPAANQSGIATITLTVSDGSASTSTSFTLVVNAIGNTPPTISSIPDQVIAANTATARIPFVIGDLETAVTNLTLSKASSNPTLVPKSGITFGGSGSNRTVKVTPATNQSGIATITLTVSDGSLSTRTSFAVTVNAGANTPPTISSIPDQIIGMNAATSPIAFVISDAETPATNLTLSSSSSNPVLVPGANIVLGGSGSNRTVKVTPAANQSGTAMITITVSDGSSSAGKSFLLTVNPGPAPTFVYLPLEAESATLVAPMAVAADSNASQGQFIQSSTDNSGTATYSVNIPVSATYLIWGRTLSLDGSQDSFFVSVDGGAEFIYATALNNNWTNAWQWTAVNSNAAGPLTFQLAAGTHNIVFRSRESNTGLDQLLITNDPSFVPNAIFSGTTPPVRISSITYDPAGSVTLNWPTVPGKTYRVVYKTKLSDSAWIPLGQDLPAGGTTASRSDYAVGNRFYSVITLP